MLFDEESENRIAQVWRTIDAGIDLIGLGARPHISLTVVRPPQDPEPLQELVESFARVARSFNVVFGSVGTFPGAEGVVFLSLGPTAELIDANAQVSRSLADSGFEVDRLYCPDRWVPHCTMALGVPPFEVERVRRRIGERDVFGEVRIEKVQLLEFRPVREIAVFSLARG